MLKALLLCLTVVAPDLSGRWEEEYAPRMPLTELRQESATVYSVAFGDGSRGILRVETASPYGWALLKNGVYYEADVTPRRIIFYKARIINLDDGEGARYQVEAVLWLKKRR